MDVSIGVIAHNEEKSINRLLDSLIRQKEERVRIREIVVVSSGSSDGTDKIVEDFCRADSRVRLVREPKRRGKSSAINLFLKGSRSGVNVLVSGDVVPEGDCIERVCSALVGNIGIASVRIVPEDNGGLLGRVIALEWMIHHQVSLRRPKFGEMVAFRGIDRIAETSVDEEFIGMLINNAGLGSVYVPEAVVRNCGPRTMKDFIKQRRRIYSGHLELSRNGYEPITLKPLHVLGGFVRCRGVDARIVLTASLLEGVSRALGFFDFISNKRKHLIWEMVRR